MSDGPSSRATSPRVNSFSLAASSSSSSSSSHALHAHSSPSKNTRHTSFSTSFHTATNTDLSTFILDYTDLLGRLLQAVGVLPFHSRYALVRWSVLLVHTSLALLRAARAGGCASLDGAQQLEDRFFTGIFILYPVVVIYMFLLLHARAGFVSRPLETSRALVVAVSPPHELDIALQHHRHRLRRGARRIAWTTIGFLLVMLVLFNASRVRIAAAGGSVADDTAAFAYSCDEAVADMLTLQVYTLLLAVSDLVVFGSGVVAVAITLWLLALYSRDVSTQRRMVEALEDEVGDLDGLPCTDAPTRQATDSRRASRLFNVDASEAVAIARRQYTSSLRKSETAAEPASSLALLDLEHEAADADLDPAEVLESDLRYQLDFLLTMENRFVPLAKHVVLYATAACAVSAQMAIPAMIKLVNLEPLSSATLFGFFAFATTYAALSLIVARGGKIVRHHRRAKKQVEALLERVGVAPDARPRRPTVAALSAPPARNKRIEYARGAKPTALARFWTRFRPMYVKLLLCAAAATALLSAFVAVSAYSRLPACSRVTVRRNALSAVFDTSDCSSSETAGAYVANSILGTAFATVSALVVIYVLGGFDVSMMRDVLPVGLSVSAVAVLLSAANGFTLRSSSVSRLPGFVAYLVVSGFTAYRLVRPGPSVNRPVLSKRAGKLWFCLFCFFAAQIVLVSGLYVLYFAFATDSVRFVMALSFPAGAAVLRLALSYLCEEFEAEKPPGALGTTAALYTIADLYLSLVGRLALVSLGALGDQVLVILLWALMEVGNRAFGHLARPALAFVLLPAGERKDREMARAETMRMSDYLRARIYGKMFAELVAICGAVVVVLVLRATVPDPSNPDESLAQGVSTSSLVVSAAIQLIAEGLSDFLGVLSEETLLERDVLALWSAQGGSTAQHIVIIASYGFAVSITTALLEFVALTGKFEVDE